MISDRLDWNELDSLFRFEVSSKKMDKARKTGFGEKS